MSVSAVPTGGAGAHAAPPPPQVYWAGPLLGAALGAVLYEFALCPRPRSLAERLAALKGEPPAAEPPPEPPAEPLELKTQGP